MKNVYIPDENFRNYLISNKEINPNGDGEILVTEAAKYTGAINCNGLKINDLTGIEAFIGLTKLICYSNQLSSLDLSSNTSLIELNCGMNQITCLNLTSNTSLILQTTIGNYPSTFNYTYDSAKGQYLYFVLSYANN